jgi:CBS domain-containing protein
MARTVHEVMTTAPLAVPPHTSVAQAAHVMRDRGIGDVLITHGDGKLAGIITDRDIVIRVIAAELDPNLTPVEDVLTPDAVSVKPMDGMDRVADLMRDHAIRRIPVVDDNGRLIGIVSLGDLAAEDDDGSPLSAISLARTSDAPRMKPTTP